MTLLVKITNNYYQYLCQHTEDNYVDRKKCDLVLLVQCCRFYKTDTIMIQNYIELNFQKHHGSTKTLQYIQLL